MSGATHFAPIPLTYTHRVAPIALWRTRMVNDIASILCSRLNLWLPELIAQLQRLSAHGDSDLPTLSIANILAHMYVTDRATQPSHDLIIMPSICRVRLWSKCDGTGLFVRGLPCIPLKIACFLHLSVTDVCIRHEQCRVCCMTTAVHSSVMLALSEKFCVV